MAKMNWELDRDTRVTVIALLTRGQPAEQVSIQTGAPLDIVRALKSAVDEQMSLAATIEPRN